VSFQDDFSVDAGRWQECRGCTWDDGVLLMGPYAPAMNPEGMLAVCLPCGTPTYFRLSVDVSHVEGQTDRGYGIIYAKTEDEFSIYEISPLFLLTLAARYDLRLDSWELLNPNVDQLLTGLVRPGKAINRLELRVEPAGPGTANYFFRINDKTAFVLYAKPASPGQVGLGIDSHAVQVGFDNFELEEIDT